MSKKLNFGVIKKEVEVYSKKEKAILDNDYHVYYYPNFAPAKIQEMLIETLTDLEKARQKGIDVDSINMIDWGYFHIIKHFCELDIPIDLELKIQAYTTIRNSEYFGKLIGLFPEESINKIVTAMDKINKNLDQFNSMSEDELNKLVGEQVETENKVVQ